MFKKKFDYLLSKGFKKKYYKRNDEEELVFTKSNYIITIYKSHENIDAIIDYGDRRENLLECKFLSSSSKNSLNSILKSTPIFDYKVQAIITALNDIISYENIL